MAENAVIEKSLGVTKAAALMGVHAVTLKTWARAGLIPHYVLCGRLRFSETELQEFVKQSHRPAVAA